MQRRFFLAIVFALTICLAFPAMAHAIRCFDVGVGARGTVWIIGARPVRGGYPVYYRKGKRWVPAGGAGVHIAGGPDGAPWLVNSFDQIFHWQAHQWIPVKGRAKDIGVGADGAVWIVGTQRMRGGFALERWTGNGWKRIDFGAARVSVGPDGRPWVVNDNGSIFFMRDRKFHKLPGKAEDIGIGPNGIPWVIGAGPTPGLMRWTGRGWQRYRANGMGVAVDALGFAWVADPHGIRKYK